MVARCFRTNVLVRVAMNLVVVLAVVPAAPAADWKEALAQRIARHPGDAAVLVLHLESGARFAHRETEVFPTASLIKLPIMVEAYRQAEAGALKLTDTLTLRADDKVPGSGILTSHFSPGATFCVRDAIRLMMAWSDNTATNLVLDRIGLPATTRCMRELGLEETRLNSKVFRRDTSLDLERSREFGLGSTTAAEITLLLERIQRGELISAEACAAMREHLAACQDKLMFARFLPASARVAHKTGGVTGIRTDAGLIAGPGGTVVLCVLTRNNRQPEGDADEPGERLCADVARLVFDQFNPPELLAAAARQQPGDRPVLQLGASGPAVKQLQQALNAALDPSPALEVDGEFGPLTAAAVERFQKSQQLEPTGIADAATWRALRP